MQKRWILTGLVGVAFCVRFLLAIGRGLGEAPTPGTDQYEYDRYAWNLAQGHGYRGPSANFNEEHLTAYRPPGTSLLWAGLYTIFGHRFEVVRIANCLLSALTVLWIYSAGTRCYGQKVGMLSATAYAVWPTALTYSADMLSEPLGTFCFLGFIALSLRFASDVRIRWAALAGFMLGYALLTRPNFLFMVPMVLLWAAWLMPRSIRMLAKAAVIPIVAVATLAPWTIRNYVQFQAFIPVSTMGGSGLLQGNNRIVVSDPKYFGYSVWDTNLSEYREALLGAKDEIDRDRRAGKFAVEWLRANPDKWWFLARSKLVRAWTPVLQPHSPRLYRIGALLSWGPVLILFVGAFFPTLLRALRRRQSSLLLHLAIVNFILITLMFWGETRYRHGVEPLCLIWASVAVVELARWLGPRSGGERELKCAVEVSEVDELR